MIYHRPYASYAAYVYKQGSKSRGQREKIFANTEGRIKTFRLRFKKYDKHLLPGKILCLGARTGCEVIAARACGYQNSIGLDLHPMGDIVIQGDWHVMPFDNESFENIYSNSLDHCLYLDKLIDEVHRVLVHNGTFTYESDTKYALDSRAEDDPLSVTEIEKVGSNRNPLNAMWWDSLKDIADEFINRHKFEIAAFYYMGKYSAYTLRKS